MSRIVTLLYFLFLISLTFFSYLFVDQNFFYFGKIYTGAAFLNRGFITLTYISFVSVFFVFYSIFLKGKFNTKFLIGLTCVILLFSYSAMLSQDIFNYLTTAKVAFNFHENPYIIMPIEFIGDTNLLFTHAANKIALYGPLWIAISGIPYLLGFGNFVLAFFNLKLVVMLFYIGTVWLIQKISKSIYAALLFALNPLIIIEALIGSHNDVVMMFLALFSFFLLKKKKILLASLFLIGSILIKYVTIFLIPVFIFAAYKTFKKSSIDWNNIYFYCWVSMFAIFLLSALRVEIYPWYATWFLVFVPLIPQGKFLLNLSLAFSFGLLLRYIPFMFFGTHFGVTPIVKTLVTFSPALLTIFYAFFKKSFR